MNQNTNLLRQVHPSFVQQGNVSSQVFQPTSKDEKKLSVYDGDQITPENSWIHYTKTLGFHSFGVLAVTVKESETIGLSVKSDPTPFPEHAIIDFSGLKNHQIKKTAKRLRTIAVKRNWLYQADTCA